jgi:general secretion pathway protein H
LLELLVVLVIVALASTGVVLALRDQNTEALDREAQRLIAYLEAARAESRSTAQAVFWRPTPTGFELRGTLPQTPGRDPLGQAKPWLHAQTLSNITTPANAQWLVLGPEPLIPAQSIALQHGAQTLTIGTDGFKAFAVQATASPSDERVRP